MISNIYISVVLFGSPNLHEGNVYARNLVSGVEGPVCDKSWDIHDVSFDLSNTRECSVRLTTSLGYLVCKKVKKYTIFKVADLN
jgi:hypothetical protein